MSSYYSIFHSMIKSIMKNKNAGRNAFIQGFILFFQGWIITGFADRANLKNDPHPNEFVFNNVHIYIIYSFAINYL